MGVLRTLGLAIVFPVLACKESAVHEYYDLLGPRDEYECECFYGSTDDVERCKAEREEQRETARGCAVDYVEDSRKHRKAVEPIYECFLRKLRPSVACIEDSNSCVDCSPAFTEQGSPCYASHLNKPDGTPTKDAAAKGYEAIQACINDASE